MVAVSALTSGLLSGQSVSVVERAEAAARRTLIAPQSGGVALSFDIDAPRLGRIGQARSVTARGTDAFGQANDARLDFTKIAPRVLRVEVNGAGASSAGFATFNIHLNENGTIRGFDTTGNGRIDSIDGPAFDLTGRGFFVQFNFDNARPGPIDFSVPGLPGEYLVLLQSANGNTNSLGSSPTPQVPGTPGGSVSTIAGTAGADSLTGTAGDDSISGLDGDDTISGGAGDDTLSGGDGTDLVDYSGAGAGVTVDLGAGTASDGSGGSDTLSGFENAAGSAHDDSLTGDAGANLIEGGDGNDTIAGGDGDDTLSGGLGADSLAGGAGDDSLTGGAGDDLFVIENDAGDIVITDFTPGNNSDDVIDLSAIGGFASVFDVWGAATTTDGNTVIDLGNGSTLTLIGVNEFSLRGSDFIF
jgi:Ca2+-binding RTX toxin-like protein